jgi:hypothetical protein
MPHVDARIKATPKQNKVIKKGSKIWLQKDTI